KDEEGFTGGYDSVQKYVKKIRDEIKSKATQELIWEPGSGQVDFGEADFIENGVCTRKKYLTVSFPYSNDGFSQVFGGETAECVCQGLQDIFEYIGGVPPLLVFDNATGVGRRVMDKVTETELFRRFRAHYGFQVRFCNPYAGWEKGNVENKVGTIRRNLFVPVESFQDVEEYNRTLLDKHEKKASEVHYKKGRVIAELFKEDQASLRPLPPKKFNVCRYEYNTADGYGKIACDGKHFYSTKPENHGQKEMVGIRAHYIDILNPDGSLLVRHKRQYGRDRTDIIDYSTSLEMLAKNPGAWLNSGVRQDVSQILRNYMDSLEKPALKNALRLMAELNREHGYSATIEAMDLAAHSGNLNKSDVAILAARISGYGIDTPPEPGPSLGIYDELLHSGEGGDAA
ncbi:MAG: IS21 family transposase, partial [Oscillospiraceae bacterium]|nr:IS21 family transposase [Oscillospiraceae bacterium]